MHSKGMLCLDLYEERWQCIFTIDLGHQAIGSLDTQLSEIWIKTQMFSF